MSKVAAKAGGMQSVEKKKKEEDSHSSESILVHQDVVLYRSTLSPFHQFFIKFRRPHLWNL